MWFMQKEKNSNGDYKYYNAVDCSYYKPGLVAHKLVAGRRYALNLPSPFPVFSYSQEYFLNGTPKTAAINDDIDEVLKDGIDHGEIHE